MPPWCSSSIFPATNRTHPFIASIARADFSVCVRPSIRARSLSLFLRRRRFMHPISTIPSLPPETHRALPLFLYPPHTLSLYRPYPFVRGDPRRCRRRSLRFCIFDRRYDSERGKEREKERERASSRVASRGRSTSRTLR